MKLDKNWKKSYKWYSQLAMGIASAIQGTYLMLPDNLKSSLSPKMLTIITICILVFGMIGRLIPQESDKKE